MLRTRKSDFPLSEACGKDVWCACFFHVCLSAESMASYTPWTRQMTCIPVKSNQPMLSVQTAGPWQSPERPLASCGEQWKAEILFTAGARDEALGISKKRHGAAPLQDNPLLFPPPIRSAAACSPKPESASLLVEGISRTHTVFSRPMPPAPPPFPSGHP